MVVRTLIITLAVGLSVGPARARAVDQLSTTDVITTGFQYVPGDDDGRVLRLEIVQGGTLRYTNADIDAHTLTSFKTRNGDPVFDSGQIPPGISVDVPGIPSAALGRYDFYCRIHPMFARLFVVTRRSIPKRTLPT